MYSTFILLVHFKWTRYCGVGASLDGGPHQDLLCVPNMNTFGQKLKEKFTLQVVDMF